MCRFHKEGFGIVIYLLRLFESLKKTLEECHIFILIFLIFSASFSSFDIFPKRTYCLAHLTVTFFWGGEFQCKYFSLHVLYERYQSQILRLAVTLSRETF